MTSLKGGTVPMGDQESPSAETSSLPESWLLSSILSTTPSSKGPKIFPVLRRTWKRLAFSFLSAFAPSAASSMKLSM